MTYCTLELEAANNVFSQAGELGPSSSINICNKRKDKVYKKQYH